MPPHHTRGLIGPQELPWLLHGAKTMAVRKRSSSLATKFAILVLFSTALFNLALCFLNTKFFHTNAQTAIGAEVLIISGTIALLLYKRDHRIALYIALLCSYFAILFIVRGAIDPKPIRDLLIPLVFIHLGQRYLDAKQTDWLVTRLTLIALAVSVFEFTFPDIFTRFFDVLSYFINKGATRAEAADFIVNGFNINGDRPTGQGRELLPFLGLHRSGSIFLEPVTAGNFGAIAGAWFLQSKRPAWRRWTWLTACAAIIVLADGRFGMMLLIIAVAVRYLPVAQRPAAIAFLPFVIVGVMMTYAGIVDASTIPGGNTYGGRLIYTGHILNHLGVLDWLGLKVQDIVYFDSGYAYSVTQIGLLALCVAWFALARSLERNASERYLGAFCMIYIALSLMVSNSMWSIKAGALLWFVVGQTVRGRRQAMKTPAQSFAPIQAGADQIYVPLGGRPAR